MSSSPDDSVGLDGSVLESASRLLDNELDDADLPEGRERFFRGIQALQSEEPEEAAREFRRAAREAEPPFDALARVARAECARVRGRTGLALREWKDVAESSDAPTAARYMAWLSIAAAADDRSDERLLERAKRAIDRLETPGET